MMQISPMILMNLIEQLRLGWPSRGMGFKYICIRACKCAGVRTCLHVHALIYVCISACAYTCIRVLYVRAIVFACMRVCVYFCMSVSFYVFMRPQINRVKFFAQISIIVVVTLCLHRWLPTIRTFPRLSALSSMTIVFLLYAQLIDSLKFNMAC